MPAAAGQAAAPQTRAWRAAFSSLRIPNYRTYFAGQSVSTDVLEASAIAYVRAVNASRHAEHGERVAGGV